jgi:hypothetical protein
MARFPNWQTWADLLRDSKNLKARDASKIEVLALTSLNYFCL